MRLSHPLVDPGMRLQLGWSAMMSRLLLWFLFISLTPAGPELVEWATHYAQDGDFADAPDAGHRRSPADQQDHGCAVLCHSCACHGPTAPGPLVDEIDQPLLPARAVRWASLQLSAVLASPQPVTPPPIA
jgi:hypothetical protein